MEVTVDIGSLLCKIGLHNGEPIETFDQKDDIADQENPVEGERRRVRCVRCGKEYTEVVNYYWYGSP